MFSDLKLSTCSLDPDPFFKNGSQFSFWWIIIDYEPLRPTGTFPEALKLLWSDPFKKKKKKTLIQRYATFFSDYKKINTPSLIIFLMLF